jgi:hypothetical protein
MAMVEGFIDRERAKRDALASFTVTTGPFQGQGKLKELRGSFAPIHDAKKRNC